MATYTFWDKDNNRYVVDTGPRGTLAGAKKMVQEAPEAYIQGGAAPPTKVSAADLSETSPTRTAPVTPSSSVYDQDIPYGGPMWTGYTGPLFPREFMGSGVDYTDWMEDLMFPPSREPAGPGFRPAGPQRDDLRWVDPTDGLTREQRDEYILSGVYPAEAGLGGDPEALRKFQDAQRLKRTPFVPETIVDPETGLLTTSPYAGTVIEQYRQALKDGRAGLSERSNLKSQILEADALANDTSLSLEERTKERQKANSLQVELNELGAGGADSGTERAPGEATIGSLGGERDFGRLSAADIAKILRDQKAESEAIARGEGFRYDIGPQGEYRPDVVRSRWGTAETPAQQSSALEDWSDPNFRDRMLNEWQVGSPRQKILDDGSLNPYYDLDLINEINRTRASREDVRAGGGRYWYDPDAVTPVTSGTPGAVTPGAVTPVTPGTPGTVDGLQMPFVGAPPAGQRLPGLSSRELFELSPAAGFKRSFADMYGPELVGTGPLAQYLSRQQYPLTQAMRSNVLRDYLQNIGDVAADEFSTAVTGRYPVGAAGTGALKIDELPGYSFQNFLAGLSDGGIPSAYRQALGNVQAFRGMDPTAVPTAVSRLFQPQEELDVRNAMDMLGTAQRARYSPLVSSLFQTPTQQDLYGDYVLSTTDRAAREQPLGAPNFFDFAASRFGL